jgi:hypothetical protein
MYPTALCSVRFLCSLPKINFKIFAQVHQSQHDENFVIMPPSKPEKSAEMLNFFPLMHIPNYQITITVRALFPNTLPCFQLTFARRTSGHCLGTLRTVNFSGCLRDSNKCCTSYCMPPSSPPPPLPLWSFPPLSVSLISLRGLSMDVAYVV